MGKAGAAGMKRLRAQAAAWARGGGRRRREAALTAILAIVISLAFMHEYWRAAFSSRPTLAEETRRAVREKAEQLSHAVEKRLLAKGRLQGEAWTSAQILIALKENNAGYAGPAPARVIERNFRAIAGPECACWRKLPAGNFPSHVGVTSWTLWALACYGIPAHRTETEFLLSAQGPEGGWPLYAGADTKRFASSYATAAAILALHEQQSREKDPARRERIAAAVSRGAEWLKSRAIGARARWADYPESPEGKKDYLGLSGFVLFALHRSGATGLAAL